MSTPNSPSNRVWGDSESDSDFDDGGVAPMDTGENSVVDDTDDGEVRRSVRRLLRIGGYDELVHAFRDENYRLRFEERFLDLLFHHAMGTFDMAHPPGGPIVPDFQRMADLVNGPSGDEIWDDAIDFLFDHRLTFGFGFVEDVRFPIEFRERAARSIALDIWDNSYPNEVEAILPLQFHPIAMQLHRLLNSWRESRRGGHAAPLPPAPLQFIQL